MCMFTVCTYCLCTDEALFCPIVCTECPKMIKQTNGAFFERKNKYKYHGQSSSQEFDRFISIYAVLLMKTKLWRRNTIARKL